MNSPVRLVIFGSCVSRDILNYPQANTRLILVDYYARCSIASLGARPIEMPSAVQTICSKFQKRMVERDIRKDFLNDLADLQFDLLLIDLIDERFNLYVEPMGKACTLSTELLSSGFPNDSARGSRIYSGSEEFLRLWEAGWSILVGKLKYLGVLDRLRINQVFWGSRTESGGNFEPNYSDRQIDSANQFLGRLYERIGIDIPSEQFLRFDHGLMTGSITHKWGISPFHFIDEYLHEAIQQLSAWPLPRLKNGIATSNKTIITRRASSLSENVILKHEQGELVAAVVFEALQRGEFAFCVFWNGKQIHTQWYSSNAEVRLSINARPGLYRVLVFFLAPNGVRTTKYSNPVFVYPVVSTLAS